MFKHILLPTDGSALSESAVLKGVEFARALGARVTGLHVSPRFHVPTYRTDMLEDARAEHEQACGTQAERYLGFVARAAAEYGVQCDTLHAFDDDVYRAVIDAAREHGCDVVAMASHGRRGASALLLGSETNRVLTHSAIPVLVWR